MQSLKQALSKLGKSLDIISPCRCICCGFNACNDGLPVCSDCISGFYKMVNTGCTACGRDIGNCDCDGTHFLLYSGMLPVMHTA